jgi:hypothetical protein
MPQGSNHKVRAFEAFNQIKGGIQGERKSLKHREELCGTLKLER